MFQIADRRSLNAEVPEPSRSGDSLVTSLDEKMIRVLRKGNNYNVRPRSAFMHIFTPSRLAVPMLLAFIFLAGVPAYAQLDLTGVWAPRVGDEDNPERLAGPSLVEYLGLPINDYARQWGLAYR